MKKSKKKRKGFVNGHNNPKDMRCPYCNQKMILRTAEGIYKDNTDAMLYVCEQYPICDTYTRVHQGTEIPMGIPANGKLRALRNQAHKQFDQIHKIGIMSKADAYVWLANTLIISQSQAHIGYFSECHCKLVIEKSKSLVDDFKEIQLKRLKLEKGGGNNARVS